MTFVILDPKDVQVTKRQQSQFKSVFSHQEMRILYGSMLEKQANAPTTIQRKEYGAIVKKIEMLNPELLREIEEADD